MKNLVLLFTLLFFISCGNEMSYGSLDEQMSSDATTSANENVQYELNDDIEMEPPRTGEPPPPNDPKIIRNATLNIEVEDYKTSRAALESVLQSANANVMSEVENDLNYQAQNVLQIRVNPNNFFPLIKEIENLAFDVKYKEVTAQDVGEEFYDLETRLTTKRAVVKRYREILKQAKNIKEILDVEERIRQVVEEIESAQGRLKYLTSRVNQSSIQLTMFEAKPTPAFAKAGFFGRLGQAFISGWSGVQEVVLLLVHFWAFFAIAGLIGLLFFRRRKI